jgi:hypothetical protein
MTRVPVRVPVEVGVNVTLKVQLALTASEKGVEWQVLVSANSPVVDMLVIVRGILLVPVFVMVTACGMLVVFRA